MTVKKKKKTIPKMKKPNRKWVNSNKPTIDGIQFDSDMEANMYRFLKKEDIKFKYIGEENGKYELIKEFQYEGESYERAQKRSKSLIDRRKVSRTGYTPDFVGENEEWFIEVKGRKLGDFNLRYKLFKLMLSFRKIKPTLFMPVTKADCLEVVQILKNKGYAKNKN